ncbi:MAG: hypothetical protein GY861_05805 [bacterium]|nr:hypothetical protein [bacterium]
MPTPQLSSIENYRNQLITLGHWPRHYIETQRIAGLDAQMKGETDGDMSDMACEFFGLYCKEARLANPKPTPKNSVNSAGLVVGEKLKVFGGFLKTKSNSLGAKAMDIAKIVPDFATGIKDGIQG